MSLSSKNLSEALRRPVPPLREGYVRKGGQNTAAHDPDHVRPVPPPFRPKAWPHVYVPVAGVWIKI